MIRCGVCGLRVTAEHKINRYGRHYIYYHCSKRRLGPRCTEPAVELRSLEQQIEEYLRTLAIEESLEAWVLEEIDFNAERFKEEKQAHKRSLEKAVEEVDAQLNELTGLRIRSLLTDAEFVARRKELQQEQLRLRGKITEVEHDTNRFEPATEVVSFSNRAAEWFLRGDGQSKRLILETVGSNLILKNKILSIQAIKPFVSFAPSTNKTRLLRVVDDVRTFCPRGKKGAAIPHQLGVVDDVRTSCRIGNKRWLNRVIKEISELSYAEDGQRILNNIRTLRERFEPEALVPVRSRRARAA